jgi:chromate reductase, NAD(P)H dehydrogenase (quinone)
LSRCKSNPFGAVLDDKVFPPSRPLGQPAPRTLGAKPVLTMTTSPASGGVRAQQQMNETLVSIPARLVHRSQIVVIGGVHEKVRDGRLVDEAALRFALAGIDNLLDEITATRLLLAAA